MKQLLMLHGLNIKLTKYKQRDGIYHLSEYKLSKPERIVKMKCNIHTMGFHCENLWTWVNEI